MSSVRGTGLGEGKLQLFFLNLIKSLLCEMRLDRLSSGGAN